MPKFIPSDRTDWIGTMMERSNWEEALKEQKERERREKRRFIITTVLSCIAALAAVAGVIIQLA